MGHSLGEYNNTRRDFYKDLLEMVDFFYEYMEACNITEVIIAPLHKDNIFAWQGNMKQDTIYNDLYIEAIEFLKKNNINKNSKYGIKISIKENRKIIKMVLEGAYRYVLELCLFFPEISVIVEPTHHFDLMFYTQNFENQQKIIRNIIKAYPNIIYYENLEVKNDNRLHK